MTVADLEIPGRRALPRVEAEGRPAGLWEGLRHPLAVCAAALVAAVVCGALAAALVRARPAIYTASATLLIDQPGAFATAPDGGVVTKLSDLRLKYAALAQTNAVTGPAAAAAGLPASVVAADASVVASSVNPLVLTAQGTAASPATAERVANAVGAELGVYATAEQAANGVAPAGRFVIREIAPAASAVKISPTSQRVIGVGLAVALVVLGLAYTGVRLLSGRRRGA